VRVDGSSYDDHVEQLTYLVFLKMDDENAQSGKPSAIPDGEAHDKLNLDIFWLRDESLEDSANLLDPDVLAAEIIEDLKSALEQFEGIALDLGEDVE
jgi:hypothetical protein